MSLFDDPDDTDLNAHLNMAGVPTKSKGRSGRPGYTTFPKGRGTYHAREHLKRLGGFWDPALKVWYIPDENAGEARRLVREAEAGRLSADDFLSPSKTAAVDVLVCWECGERVLRREVVTRGGVLDEFYCGCAEGVDFRSKRLAR